MTHKKIVMPILALAVIIPALVFAMSDSTSGVQLQEKIVTQMSFDEDSMDLASLTERSELVIEGKILNSNVFTKKVHDEQVYPDIYTTQQVQIVNVLKGETTQKVISVVVHGGEVEDRISKTEAIPTKDNDTVILFLEENGAHYSNNAYNPIAPIQGVFLVEDSIVKSGAFVEIQVDDFKQAISLAQQN